MSKKGRRTPAKSQAHPVFTVRFTEGLATRNRLPLDHVIRVLTEIKGMLETVGKQVQRQRGAENPTGDFGIELIAGFQKGSVQTTLAITRDVDAGVIAAAQVLDAVAQLASSDPQRWEKARKAPRKDVAPEFDPRLISRMGSIGKIQEIDKTRVELKLKTSAGPTKKAVFDRRTTQIIETLRAPNFATEDITIYGKLRELKDKSEDDESTKAFFGELIGDDGNTWRIEFKAKDAERASHLFRKQVFVTGTVTYFKAMNPRIQAVEFGPDEERDYEAAFDELFGSSKEFKDTDLATLIRELDE